MTTFPEQFLWGAATAGHQIEGNNVNSDWWAREQLMPVSAGCQAHRQIMRNS